MKVGIVGITQPRIEGLDSASDLVSYCARVSNPGNQLNKNNTGLLKYCIKHKHFSIFEMVNVVVSIETTRDIGRQILRHRSFSFQEFSQRYSTTKAEMVERETRLQDTVNKQNSIIPDKDDESIAGFKHLQDRVWGQAQYSYNQALEMGVAKEQARALLPEGLTTTNMYMNGSLRSWITYCQVRCGVETQKEHRDIAKAIVDLLMVEFPFLEEVLSECLQDTYSAES
jgi:thymidylate synthase (FAD)